MVMLNNIPTRWFLLVLVIAAFASAAHGFLPLENGSMEQGAIEVSAVEDGGALGVTYLGCESRIDPLGIDVPKPRLSWILTARDEKKRGLRQTAYQIVVSSSKKRLSSDTGDLWDSGKKISDQNTYVDYAGRPLASGVDCWWKVRVWDNEDRVSAWSEPARWSMGMLRNHDWTALWIGYVYKAKTNPKLPQATYWRKEIDAEKGIARAMLYASALGAYVLNINGQRVGEDYFNPGWPEFRKRIYYHTYDVTSMLQPGRNALGAILSTGWYAGYIWAGPFNYGTTPKLLAQLIVEYVDGTTKTFGTDSTWKVSYGPLLEADIQMGEKYDAQLEIPNWNRPGFNDAGWARPDVVQEAIPAKMEKENRNVWLYAAPHPPVRRQREIAAVNRSSPQPGVHVFDLGETIAGWAKLKARGPKGDTVSLRFSGMLNPDGSIYHEYLREARATDTYILKGAGQPEVWEPMFTYHGFRYVEVTGYPGVPTLDAITGVECNSDVERTGQFTCSDTRVNQLYKNSVTTMVGNFVDLVAGCSDRAERLGWMGSGQMFYSGCYTYDLDAFLKKWYIDMVDAQSLGASGSYLQVSPMWGDIESPGWSDDGVCAPYALHRFYGNTHIIKKNYHSLVTYMRHIDRSLTNSLRLGAVYHPDGQKFVGYGDWLAIAEDREVHSDVLNTLWNGWSVSNMVEMAKAIGKEEDAAKYEQLLTDMKTAFDKAYISADGKVKHDIQSEYALGLYFGFIPEKKLPRAVDHLVDDILNKSHKQMREDALKGNPIIPPGHLTTGFHGSRALLPVLSTYGRNDVAYKLLLTDTYPSWLYPVTVGATSVWERWDSWMPDKGFQDPRMNSFGMPHLMSSIIEWLMGYAGGIQPAVPGFERIAVKPYVGEGLNWVDVSYRSIQGNIAVKWERQKDGLMTMRVVIPPNTQATISVPKDGKKAVVISEGGKPIWSKKEYRGKVAGITGAAEETEFVNFTAGSGAYDFRVVAEE